MLTTLRFVLATTLAVGGAASPIDAQTRGSLSSGGLIGIGFAENTHTRYDPIHFAADLSWALRTTERLVLAWYIEPQVNLVLTDRAMDAEVGGNIGIRSLIRVTPDAWFYQMAGTGPFYFSADVERQARGFVFSDNAAIGLYIRMHRSAFLNLQLRARHLSNAGLSKPNGGINTFNVLLGVTQIQLR